MNLAKTGVCISKVVNNRQHRMASSGLCISRTYFVKTLTCGMPDATSGCNWMRQRRRGRGRVKDGWNSELLLLPLTIGSLGHVVVEQDRVGLVFSRDTARRATLARSPLITEKQSDTMWTSTLELQLTPSLVVRQFQLKMLVKVPVMRRSWFTVVMRDNHGRKSRGDGGRVPQNLEWVGR